MKSLLNSIKSDPEHKNIRDSITIFASLGALGLCQVLKGLLVAVFPSFLPLFFTAQFFGSTIQGFISDIIKRSLVFNISLCVVILITSTLAYTNHLHGSSINLIQMTSIVLFAIGGNADIVGRAEIIDIRYKSDRRKVMSWTVFSEAFSWVLIGLLMRYFQLNPFNILVGTIFLAVALLIISLIFNNDKTRDPDHWQRVKNALKPALKKHFNRTFFAYLIVLTGELAYFFFFYSQVNPLDKNAVLLADSYLSSFIGMSLGCVFVGSFKKTGDFSNLMIGFLVSFLSIVLFISGGMETLIDPGVFKFDSFIFLLNGFGSGIFLPCFYSMISRGHSVHVQGFLTGTIDSLRVLGDSLTSTVLVVTVAAQSPFPIYISCMLFSSSIILLVFYKKNNDFKKS